jgi:GT2 family glycosyltransferase
MNRRVCVIILAWNGLAYTQRCLETLRRLTRFPNYRVVVVDNNSTDGTPAWLAQQEDLTILRNEENVGFVRGNNQALRLLAPDEDAILLNNDTEIIQADWIERLQQTAYAVPTTGIVGCRLRHPSGFLQHAGVYLPPHLWGQQIGGLELDINQFNTDREVESVVFACVYLKHEVLDRVGLLNEAYTSYFEDTDYCLQAREQGFRCVCCGSVTVLHHENTSVKVNGANFEEIFEKARTIFTDRWKTRLDRARYQRQLGWHSLLNFDSGYALSSGQLMKALDRHGVELSYRYIYGPGTPHPRPEPAGSDDYVLNLLRARPLQDEGVQVVYAQGDVFDRNTGRYRIGFTMLEVDGVPTDWVAAANRMDEVWVPSTFNAETFRQSGVTRPIHVIPLGIDPGYFNPSITSYRLGDIFTFLSLFEWGERKAPEILLRAFNAEFRREEDVVLICKTSNQDHLIHVRAKVARLGLDPCGGRIIFSENEIIPTSQRAALYRSADCFVLSTRGEGWGLPLLEAMGCGLPVIATDWSAPRDFMNETNAYPVQVKRLVSAEARCPYYHGFQWAEPSFEHLRAQMRYVFEHRDEAKAKGLKASQDAHTHWTWEQSAQRILRRLDEIGS